MARRLPNNELVIYPDAGHGVPSSSTGSSSRRLVASLLVVYGPGEVVSAVAVEREP
jgi:pimeloyl-ACP methyl ester carboxylesterase